MSNKENFYSRDKFELPIEFLENKTKVLDNLKQDLELETTIDSNVPKFLDLSAFQKKFASDNLAFSTLSLPEIITVSLFFSFRLFEINKNLGNKFSFLSIREKYF